MDGHSCTKQAETIGETVRLTDYNPGQRGCIVRVQGDNESRRRLSEMGFTRGVEVLVVRNAPLTDPVEYMIKGYHVSLRKEQAAEIVMDRPVTEAGANE